MQRYLKCTECTAKEIRKKSKLKDQREHPRHYNQSWMVKKGIEGELADYPGI